MSKTISEAKLFYVMDKYLTRDKNNEDRPESTRPKSGSSIGNKGNYISTRRNSIIHSGAWSVQDKEV